MAALHPVVSQHRVHVVGASGSGTSTLGRTLAEQLQWKFFDTDEFYWMPSEPPFQSKRAIPERIALLEAELPRHDSWVLSGSLAGWGDSLARYFTDIVFLTLDPVVRLERLTAREASRYGVSRLAPGGDMHEAHAAFMAWAALYDESGHSQRSRSLHETWLRQMPPDVRIHRLDSNVTPAALATACRHSVLA